MDFHELRPSITLQPHYLTHFDGPPAHFDSWQLGGQGNNANNININQEKAGKSPQMSCGSCGAYDAYG